MRRTKRSEWLTSRIRHRMYRHCKGKAHAIGMIVFGIGFVCEFVAVEIIEQTSAFNAGFGLAIMGVLLIGMGVAITLVEC